MKPKSQNERVLSWLKKYRRQGLSQLQCYTAFDPPILRLAARVCDLRKQGHDITAKNIRRVNSRSQVVSYTRYYLAK